jgi:hypothetical protein
MLVQDLDLIRVNGDEVTFVQTVDPSGSLVRVNKANNALTAELLNIKHTSSGKNGSVVDRHLTQMQQRRLIGGLPRLVTCNVTFAIDKGFYTELSPMLSTSVAADLFSMIASIIIPGYDPGSADWTDVDGTFAALLRGES